MPHEGDAGHDDLVCCFKWVGVGVGLGLGLYGHMHTYLDDDEERPRVELGGDVAEAKDVARRPRRRRVGLEDGELEDDLLVYWWRW